MNGKVITHYKLTTETARRRCSDMSIIFEISPKLGPQNKNCRNTGMPEICTRNG